MQPITLLCIYAAGVLLLWIAVPIVISRRCSNAAALDQITACCAWSIIAVAWPALIPMLLLTLLQMGLAAWLLRCRARRAFRQMLRDTEHLDVDPDFPGAHTEYTTWP